LTEPQNDTEREGTVLRASAGRCVVRCDSTDFLCELRGRLKQGRRRTQTVVVAGDRVRFRALEGPAASREPGAAVVEDVLPRRNRIARRAALRSGGRVEQILMANLDAIVVVQSVTAPAPQSGFVDRLLVAAERYGVAGSICLNKIDLDPTAAADPIWTYYDAIGYSVLPASARTGAGCPELAARLAGRISLLLGASGVGKTSLLNALEPGLGLRVRTVTAKTGLGRHTTSRTELFPLRGGGYIADSPGLRGFALWDVEPQALADYFPDFREPSARCRFRTCRHREEPDCGVREAAARGELPSWRLAAYLQLLADLEQREQREHRGRSTGGGRGVLDGA
jgi:ribosome biogenesis GTPase